MYLSPLRSVIPKRPEKLYCLSSFLMQTFAVIHLLTVDAVAAGGEHGHGGQIVPMLLQLAVILVAARLAGRIMAKLSQPTVLGELLVGIILGNMYFFGLNTFEFLKSNETLMVLSELGVILLLFEVGLETSVVQMRKVGLSSLLAALLGIIAPFFLGWGCSYYFLSGHNPLVHVFIGATLTATSVGITARVLKEINKIQTPEARIILGAAVIDDVLGLIVLAVVVGLIDAANAGHAFEYSSLFKVIAMSFGFLILSILLGRPLVSFLFRSAASEKMDGTMLAMALVICFGFSYLAAIAGLAPIVGAFTAGLVIEPDFYEHLKSDDEHDLHIMLKPLMFLLLPIFFVVMGAKVDISQFMDGEVIVFALALTLAAIIGKQVCGLGVVDQGVCKTAVGLGMIPRGEVGLIFAGIGLGLRVAGEQVITSGVYGAVVFMVCITTLVTPPFLKWRFLRLK